MNHNAHKYLEHNLTWRDLALDVWLLVVKHTVIYYDLSQFNHVHAAMVVNKTLLQTHLTRNLNYSIIVLAMKKISNGNKLNRLRRCFKTDFLILLKSFNNFCIELTNLLHDASGFLFHQRRMSCFIDYRHEGSK